MNKRTNHGLKNNSRVYLRQMLEKYKNLAKEHKSGGDGVELERCLQMMDHYQRQMNVLGPAVNKKYKHNTNKTESKTEINNTPQSNKIVNTSGDEVVIEVAVSG